MEKVLFATCAAVSLSAIPFSIFVDKNPGTTALHTLIERERAFARHSETIGMGEAFLTYLAEDGLVFQPGPLKGKEVYADVPNVPGVLTWGPVWADISDTGDLGYTTGPYEYRENGADTPVNTYGHYMSVWKRQADGTLRVLLDIGISHDKPDPKAVPMEWLEMRTDSSGVFPQDTVDKNLELQALQQDEQAFLRASASEGFVNAFATYADSGVRLYRQGLFPALGLEKSLEMLSEEQGFLTWKTTAYEISASGDLGYTYGISTLLSGKENAESAEAHSYIRIWKKSADRHWKIVLDVAVPMPAL